MTGLARWRGCALLAIAYLLTGELAIHIQLADHSPVIWPPTGLALAVMLLYGPRLWPGVVVGTFALVFTRSGSLTAAAWIACADVCEVLLAWWVLCAILHVRRGLDRARDVIALTCVAFATAFMSSWTSYAGLVVTGILDLEHAPSVVYAWWWSHAGADLLLVPLLLTWLTRSPHRVHTPGPNVVEIVALAGCVAIVDVALFSETLSGWAPGAAPPFFLLPLLLWAGLRFGPRGAATANFALGSMAILSATRPGGPFHDLPDLEIFLSITTVATLLLSAVGLEKVRAVERRSALQHAALDAVVSIDDAGRITEFNPAAEKLFGYAALDVLGKDATLLIPASRQPAYLAALRGDPASAWLRDGQRYRTRARRKDGTEVPVELSIASGMYDGESVRTGFIRDLSAETRAETERLEARTLLEQKVRERTRELTETNMELERREAMLRDAEELAHLGSFEYELETKRLTWSPELYRIYGRDPETFTPTFSTFLGAIVEDDRPKIRALVGDAIKHTRAFAFDERIRRPDGSVRELSTRGKVFASDHGTRIGGCCQDVTEHNAADYARHRLADIAESSEDAMIGLDINGTIVSWNAAATTIFGYEREEAIGQSFSLLSAPEELETLKDRIRQVAHGAHFSHYELKHRRKDGSVFDASVTTSAIRGRDGTVIGLSKVLRDITQQKLVENRLRSSLEEKEVLLREVHHRVKNNLQVVSSLLNLQLAGESNPQSRRSLLESQTRIQSMALVHQLLYQSHDFARIDVTDYLRTLATRILSTYNVRPDVVSVVVDGPAVGLGIDRVIPCGLIVNELVANALEHAFVGRADGHIWIDVRHDIANQLSITVIDDGIGIGPDVTFDDVHSFGLQIAYTLTRQLEGVIAVQDDNGTCVSLTFPIAAAAGDFPREAAGQLHSPAA